MHDSRVILAAEFHRILFHVTRHEVCNAQCRSMLFSLKSAIGILYVWGTFVLSLLARFQREMVGVQLFGAGDTAFSKVSFLEFGKHIPHKLLLFCRHFAAPPTSDKPQARDREICTQYCFSSCPQQIVMGIFQAYSEHGSFLL